MKCLAIFGLFALFLVSVDGYLEKAASLPEVAVVDGHSRKISKRRTAEANEWCGMGDVQDDKHEDEWFHETDRCCREHSSCPHVIPPGETKYGLQNYGSFPASECSCDVAFKNCLGDSDDEFLSFVVQLKYFSVLPIRCFNLVNGVGVWNETLSIGDVVNDLTSVILDDINDYFLIERRI